MNTPQPSPISLSDELDKLIEEHEIGIAVCAACKHDVYSHYWNGAGSGENSGWDSCHAEDCNCKGEWSEPEPNTIDSCDWLKREFVPDAGFKAAITAAYAEAIRGCVPQKMLTDKPDDVYDEAYFYNLALDTMLDNLEKKGLLPAAPINQEKP